MSCRHNDAALTAKILEEYQQFIRSHYVNELTVATRERIALKLENLDNEIKNMRKNARLGREDAIEKLSKDLEQAKALGITDNLLIRMTEERSTGQNANIISGSQIVRNYMRGTRALKTELDVLFKRKSDDPYIYGLREKQLELETLKNLQITEDKFNPYLQDGETLIPQRPIKPRKTLALALSVIIGGFLGMLLALLVNGIQTARQQEMK